MKPFFIIHRHKEKIASKINLIIYARQRSRLRINFYRASNFFMVFNVIRKSYPIWEKKVDSHEKSKPLSQKEAMKIQISSFSFSHAFYALSVCSSFENIFLRFIMTNFNLEFCTYLKFGWAYLSTKCSRNLLAIMVEESSFQ